MNVSRALSLNLTDRPFWTRAGMTLIPVKGVLGAPELVSGLLHRQEPVAAGGSTDGEEKGDDLRE
jgi:hypothetical protein